MLDCSLDALRSCGAIPHWLSVGCVELDLNPKQRMHFWHPDGLPKSPDLVIHTDRYSFSSRVIAGQMIHETWTFDPVETGDTELIEVIHQPDHDDLVPIATGIVTMSGRYTLPAGASFFSPACGFRRSITRKAVILLCRGETETETTRILRPTNYCPATICPILRTIDQCWEIIAALLGDLPIAGR